VANEETERAQKAFTSLEIFYDLVFSLLLLLGRKFEWFGVILEGGVRALLPREKSNVECFNEQFLDVSK
jgi:hypothetical protein